MTFATPVGAGSALKGVAAGDVYMESMVANVASIQHTPQSFAFLVSADGKIIAHKDQGLALKPITELSKDLAIEPLLAAAKNKGLLPTDIAGRSRLLSVVPIAGTSWMLVVALDEREAMAPIRAVLATSLVSSLLVLVVAVALLGVVLTRRLRQLTLVRDAMHEIGAGDGDLSRRIDAHGEDELAQIPGSFNSFAGKLSGGLAQIRDASSSVRVAAKEIATGNHDLTREIKTLINTSVEQVENGSRLVHDAGTTMTDIVTSVQRVTNIMAEITASTYEQSTSINEVGQAVAQLDQMTQQNAALLEESAAAAQSLKDQSVRLSEVVATFRLSTTDAAHSAPRLSPPGG